jgi:hypothetical protein
MGHTGVCPYIYGSMAGRTAVRPYSS